MIQKSAEINISFKFEVVMHNVVKAFRTVADLKYNKLCI